MLYRLPQQLPQQASRHHTPPATPYPPYHRNYLQWPLPPSATLCYPLLSSANISFPRYPLLPSAIPRYPRLPPATPGHTLLSPVTLCRAPAPPGLPRKTLRNPPQPPASPCYPTCREASQHDDFKDKPYHCKVQDNEFYTHCWHMSSTSSKPLLLSAMK